MELSKIILGTAPYGTGVAKKEAFSIMARYLALGGNAFDTARVYGEGLSEKTVGAFIRSEGIRDKVAIVTKGAHYRLGDSARTPRLSEAEIREDFEKSLDALDTDYVDVYLLHRDDPTRPAGEILTAMNRLVKEGYARAIGVSNWKYCRIEEANAYADAYGLVPFTCNQVEFSRAVINPGYGGDPTLEALTAAEYQKALQNPGVGIMAYSSQAGGLFYKTADSFEKLSPFQRAKYDNADTRYNRELLIRAAEALSSSAAVVALGSLLSDKAGVRAVIGGRTAEQVAEAMRALRLDPAAMAELAGRLRR